MGIPLMIMGQSGSGKSTSLRNFKKGEVAVLNVAGKPLPFRNDLESLTIDDPRAIMNILKKNMMNCYVIDDSQYLMAFKLINKWTEQGYQKYTEIAKDFRDLISTVVKDTSDDTIVYFLHHTEQTEDGHYKAKTSGKMIDNWLTLEGLFSIVLMATTDGKKHQFITQSDGTNTCKSPIGMFEPEIDNDLKAVDTAIREYYGLAKLGKVVKKEKPVDTADRIPE
jgi:GTPase SAR1 family protein